MYRLARLALLAALIFTCALATRPSAAQSSPAQPSAALSAAQAQDTLREPFLSLWQLGGIELFGYPISPELREVSLDDGQTYTVQYFERVRLELHPAASPLVQIGRLGAELTTSAPALP